MPQTIKPCTGTGEDAVGKNKKPQPAGDVPPDRMTVVAAGSRPAPAAGNAPAGGVQAPPTGAPDRPTPRPTDDHLTGGDAARGDAAGGDPTGRPPAPPEERSDGRVPARDAARYTPAP